LAAARVREFCQQFPPKEFYLDEQAVFHAIQHQSQFNIIHPQSGLKVDVIIPAPTEFNESRFNRAKRIHAGVDWDAAFSAPEDAIIKKMEYFKEGASEKHLRDITGVLKTSREIIDTDYIGRWADTLNLTEIWQAILERMSKADN
jgi:hypothetical protein